MPRVAGASLPTVDDILALRETDSRDTALNEMGAYRFTGTVYSPQSGVYGTVEVLVSGTDQYRVDSDYGKFGFSRTAVNGNQAWVESSFGPFEELHGTFLEQAKYGHPASDFGDWRDFSDSIEVLRGGEVEGQEVYALRLGHGDLPPATIYVDTTTGDVLETSVVVLQEGGIGIEVTTQYEDYREVHGVRIPFRTISSNEHSGQAITQYEAIDINLDIEDDVFILTAPGEG